MQISDKAIAAIKGNNVLTGRLMAVFNRSQDTIENWLNSKDIRLTTPAAVQLIQKIGKLRPDEILEDSEIKDSQYTT